MERNTSAARALVASLVAAAVLLGCTACHTSTAGASPPAGAASDVPSAAAAGSVQKSWFVNVGGPAFVDATGQAWSADRFSIGGRVTSTSRAIAGWNARLLKDQRVGIASLNIPAKPGTYRVRLIFADVLGTREGANVMQISAEGEVENDSLDVWDRAGGGLRRYDDTFNVRVRDSELNILLRATKGRTSLAGFVIQPKDLAPTEAGGGPPETTPVPPNVPVVNVPTKARPGGGRLRSVTTSEQLASALGTARPGDIIFLAPGRYLGKTAVGDYSGSFVLSGSGRPDARIVLTGPRTAVIDGDGPGGRYGLYGYRAMYWTVRGITVANASKGIVLDRSSRNVIQGVSVRDIGGEGIHLRSFSSNNLLLKNVVTRTGLKNATHGEGIYIGSANSNWGTYSGGRPDASDRNRVIGNVISRTAAESIDVKEGSRFGLIRGNRFYGAGMTGSWADSWIDLKGNRYLVEGNVGSTALQDGYQIHAALPGWGINNTLRGNTANVRGPGYGFWLQDPDSGNVISCGNVVRGAASGFSNIPCKR